MSDRDPVNRFQRELDRACSIATMVLVVLIHVALVAFIFALLLSVANGAEPPQAAHAVVRVPSHGGSATVIATGQGRTLFLSCAHMFEGQARSKRIVIDAPSPEPGQPRQVGTRLLDVDYRADLSLFELNAGPLPYVAPVAPAGYRPARQVLSVGYDEMRLPPQIRTATLAGADSLRWYTAEKPWHGRSGGGLIDPATGYTIGVVQGYEVPAGGRGIYASHAAILTLLRRNGFEPDGSGRISGAASSPRPTPPDLYWRDPVPRSQRLFPGTAGRDCPT